MTNAELLQLNPQHIEELRSFHAGFAFDNVDVVAKECALPSSYEESLAFANKRRSLWLDDIFRGESHTHFLFGSDEDDTFYCFSYANIGGVEERIIFKLTRKQEETS